VKSSYSMFAPVFLDERNLEAEKSFLFDKIWKKPGSNKSYSVFRDPVCFVGFCHISGAELFNLLQGISLVLWMSFSCVKVLYLPAGVQSAGLGLFLCASSTIGLWSLFYVVCFWHYFLVFSVFAVLVGSWPFCLRGYLLSTLI